MKLGRPKQFDRTKALETAMQLFWKHGYEATGLNTLIEHMGIGRQSLYDTYGDKHALFIQAVEHYVKKNSMPMLDALTGPNSEHSALDNIRGVLHEAVNAASCDQCRGCLLTNCIVELAPHDQQVAAIVRSVINRIEKAFRQQLQRAIDDGQISTEIDPTAAARFLNGVMQGIFVLGKTQASRKSLMDVATMALSTLE